jgi:hypothetical protein
MGRRRFHLCKNPFSILHFRKIDTVFIDVRCQLLILLGTCGLACMCRDFLSGSSESGCQYYYQLQLHDECKHFQLLFISGTFMF